MVIFGFFSALVDMNVLFTSSFEVFLGPTHTGGICMNGSELDE